MLQVGDKIPSFSLQDQNDTPFSIEDYKGKQSLVIYFYPMDDTPGCTKQACSFRDAFEEFTDLNVKVIGISSDSVKKHKAFEEKHQLPFTLLADINKKVRRKFGVKGSLLGLLPGRVTFVIDDKGIVQYVFDSQFQSEKHITNAIKILKNL